MNRQLDRVFTFPKSAGTPADDHEQHYRVSAATGERIEEASVVIGDRRVYWCGFSIPVSMPEPRYPDVSH